MLAWLKRFFREVFCEPMGAAIGNAVARALIDREDTRRQAELSLARRPKEKLITLTFLGPQNMVNCSTLLSRSEMCREGEWTKFIFEAHRPTVLDGFRATHTDLIAIRHFGLGHDSLLSSLHPVPASLLTENMEPITLQPGDRLSMEVLWQPS
jgi:hypothetical protein